MHSPSEGTTFTIDWLLDEWKKIRSQQRGKECTVDEFLGHLTTIARRNYESRRRAQRQVMDQLIRESVV